MGAGRVSRRRIVGGREPWRHGRFGAPQHDVAFHVEAAVDSIDSWRDEHGRVHGLRRVRDEQHGNHEEDGDLDRAEDHAGPGRDLDAAVGQEPDHDAAEHREHKPEPVVREPGQLGDERGAEEAERAEEGGGDDRLGQGEGPGHQPADERPEATGDIRIHAARR